ncbi:MAG: hypothetical protein ACE366_11560 [Bradymonadia bacterium]
MGAVILTIPGPWGKLPTWPSAIPLTHDEAEPGLAGDIKAFARQAAMVDALDMGQIKRHAGIVRALVDFEEEGTLQWATAGAKLMVEAFAAGAPVVLVETASKVIDPKGLDGADLTDPVALVHLYVSVFGDGEQVYTEGLQVFDLPDVVVSYRNEAEGVLAQGAAFAYAALSVCEGLRLSEGGTFTASESAPTYTCAFEATTEADLEDDPLANPRGVWRLTRVS